MKQQKLRKIVTLAGFLFFCIYLTISVWFLRSAGSWRSKGLLQLENTPPEKWSQTDVGLWLHAIDLHEAQAAFLDAGIDGPALLQLTAEDVQTTLSIKSDFQVRKLLLELGRLKSEGKFHPEGVGVMEVSLYKVGSSMKDPPVGIIHAHPFADLNTLMGIASGVMGKTVESLVDEEGNPIQPQALPDKMYALCHNEFFMWPPVETGFSRVIHLQQAKKNLTMVTLSGPPGPQVFVIKNFLSDSECTAIMELAKEKMAPSTVRLPGAKDDSRPDSLVRTSTTAWMSNDSPILRPVRERVAEFTKMPMRNAEQMQVLRYQTGQHYYAHHDYFDPKIYPDPSFEKINRMVTVLFYLTDGYEGGETVFPYIRDPSPVADYTSCARGDKVSPAKGQAVLFYSMKPDGLANAELDPMSLHGACDVRTQGAEKWAANYWIRNAPFG